MLLAEPQKRRWTRDEYHRMADLGLFREQRVELLAGEVVQMAAQKETDVIGVSLTAKALAKAFGDGFWPRTQAPLNIDRFSEPEPDVTVVPGSERDYLWSDNRAEALLVVEISDTTLAYDRGRKARRYARARIADYWVLDLVHRRLEVRRNPQRIGSGYRYASVTIHLPDDGIAPLAAPTLPTRVADMLP